MMNRRSTTAVVYHFFEKNEIYRDNLVFFLARAWQPDLDFFVIISDGFDGDLPQRANIRYIHTANLIHDFASYTELVTSGALDSYDRLIFVNCTVRGPFLPPYVSGSWTTPFLDLLVGDVHLCGATINILHDTRPYHALYRERHPHDPAPYSHVQSSAHAMTADCFAFLKSQNLYAQALALDKDGAITECELGMSQLVRGNGWNISCLLPPYGALDYRRPHSDINPTTTTGHPQAKQAYFGQTPHPYELVFIKTGWGLFSGGGLDFHTLMGLQYHPRPSLDWAGAHLLRSRLARRIGGSLAAQSDADHARSGQTPVAQAAPPPVRSDKTRQSCLLVLGMHRSGTSALAGVLTCLGVALPKTQMEPHFSNPRGFFESIPVRDFNDRVLASVRSSWKDWRPISPDWFTSPEAVSLQAEAVKLLDQEFSGAEVFVLKDPRICRLVPFWRAVLERRGTDVLALHTHRHPLEVSGSLAARYRFNPGFTHLVWLRHTLEAEAGSRGLLRHFTSYDRLLENPSNETARLAQTFGLALPVVATAGEMRAFISPALRNHRSEPGAGSPPDLAPWYRDSLTILDQWARSGEDRAGTCRLDAIRAAFDATVPVFDAILAERSAAP